MIAHLFTLIWNKKKSHALLILEIWASFLVLFGIGSVLVYNVGNYVEPIGFAYENIWAINLNNNQDTVAVAEKTGDVFRRLKGYPAIESASRMSDNFPFSQYHNNTSISHNKVSVQVASYVADEHFARTLAIPLVAGSWYRGADSVGKYQPIVLNRKAAEALFGPEQAVGKLIQSPKQWRVAGVIDSFKGKGEFTANEPALFELLDEKNTWHKTMLIRVKPGTEASFEAKLIKDLARMIPGWSVDVTYLTDARKTQHNVALIPMTILLIVSAFLLINVALGLFGVLNVSITRRRSEIGLRRAVGATEGGIAGQFVGEMWVLATFAVVLGLVLAVQFPLLNVFDLPANVYLLAMAIAAAGIYLLVTLCALFPSRQAATVHPAVALHEE